VRILDRHVVSNIIIVRVDGDSLDKSCEMEPYLDHSRLLRGEINATVCRFLSTDLIAGELALATKRFCCVYVLVAICEMVLRNSIVVHTQRFSAIYKIFNRVKLKYIRKLLTSLRFYYLKCKRRLKIIKTKARFNLPTSN